MIVINAGHIPLPRIRGYGADLNSADCAFVVLLVEHCHQVFKTDAEFIFEVPMSGSYPFFGPVNVKVLPPRSTLLCSQNFRFGNSSDFCLLAGARPAPTFCPPSRMVKPSFILTKLINRLPLFAPGANAAFLIYYCINHIGRSYRSIGQGAEAVQPASVLDIYSKIMGLLQRHLSRLSGHGCTLSASAVCWAASWATAWMAFMLPSTGSRRRPSSADSASVKRTSHSVGSVTRPV